MAIDTSRAKALIAQVLSEIIEPDGSAALSRFPSLRAVDAKVREVQLVLGDANAANLADAIAKDEDFSANSRRVRLEALANHCLTAIRFLDGGAIQPRKRLYPAPDLAALTTTFPDLDRIVRDRWLEALKCQHAKAYLAAVILMGSILEALLLARASRSSASAYQARSAPKNKDGRNRAIPDWTLHDLIEVATELGWIKTDRGKFGHALRASRNVVHPYEHARSGANFDEHTCKTSWHVLNASVDDLLASIREGA